MIDNTKEFEENEKPFGDFNTKWKTISFEIKPEHIKLIQNFQIGWQDDEFGSPEVDPKRPYGNSSVFQDMIETLGFEDKETIFYFNLFGKEYVLHGEDKYNIDLDGHEDLEEILLKLHKETETALQLCLALQTFEPGIYIWHEYHHDFIKKVEK
jgi:hypothetical protein